MSKPKIVFFGSGPVAAKSLELLTSSFEIEAVVTKPKPTHHKGSFPVLELAEKLELAVYMVSSRSELSDLVKKNPFASELGVLIDFGIIVSQDVIDYFKKGIVNSHFSLLPEWRGADPISFAILSGQKTTGVSLMLLVEAMDEGPLLAQAQYEIKQGETTPSLTEALIELSNWSLQEILPLWLAGETKEIPQTEATIATSNQPSYSRKLTKKDGQIGWNESAEVIERKIRAFLEWPKCTTVIAGKEVIVTKAHVEQDLVDRVQGTVFATDDKKIAVQTSKGLLIIDALKPAGKQEITAQEFLHGYSV